MSVTLQGSESTESSGISIAALLEDAAPEAGHSSAGISFLLQLLELRVLYCRPTDFILDGAQIASRAVAVSTNEAGVRHWSAFLNSPMTI